MAILKFLKAMRNRRASEWTDIKELSPLKFMPYMAELFKNITGKDLKGLGDFTRWIGLGGYYHWKLAQLGQLQACPRLQGSANQRPSCHWVRRVLSSAIGDPYKLRCASTSGSVLEFLLLRILRTGAVGGTPTA